jgi:hypothetical protein
MASFSGLGHFEHDPSVISAVLGTFGVTCSSDYGSFQAILFHGDTFYDSGELRIMENSARLVAFTGDAVVGMLQEGDTVTVGGTDYAVREKVSTESSGLSTIRLSFA